MVDRKLLELDVRLEQLDLLLAKHEKANLHDQVRALEERLESVGRPARALGIKAALAAALAALVPMSTALYGWMEKDRLRLEAEHANVKSHLPDVLMGNAEEHYAITRIRHLRFLADLAPNNEQPDHDDLKSILGHWARDEYAISMAQVQHLSEELAEKINERRVHIALLETDLRVDRGWYSQEANRWVRERVEVNTDLQEAITVGFEARTEQLEEHKTVVAELERKWAQLASVQVEREPQSGPLEPTEFLGRLCRPAIPDESSIGNASQLSACTKEAKLYYGRALELGANHVDYRQLLERANDGFEAACQQSSAEACHLLATSYRRKHVSDPARQAELRESPYARPLALLTQASNWGYSEAHNSLGWYYMEGEGVEVDMARAKELFDIACELHSLNGCDSLGTWYQRVDDVENARVWFGFACEGGDVRGCANLINIEHHLQPSKFEMAEPVESFSAEPFIMYPQDGHHAQ